MIETFLDKAEDQPQIGKQFVPPMMDPVLGDYARNLPDARESEVLSLFATIINKYAVFSQCLSLLVNIEMVCVCVCVIERGSEGGRNDSSLPC